MKLRCCLLLCFFAMAGNASAQTVYKCATDKGVVYSQQPCSVDPSKVEALEIKPLKSSGVPFDDVHRVRMMEGVERSRIQYSESNCMTGAELRINRDTNALVSGYQQRIRGLEARISLANNNLAGAQWESGM